MKIETDHIVPRSEGGSDGIDNAIPVCFECHAEIHSYNDKHPRGRKFLPDELRGHKEQWLQVCKSRPEIFINASRDSDVGPIQGLVDELEFNSHVSKHAAPGDLGCPFHDDQFRRATQEGSIAILSEDLKTLVLEAYRAMGRANQLIRQALSHGRTSLLYSENMGWAREAITEAEPKIAKALIALLEFLGADM